MLPNDRTTRSDVVTLPGEVEGLVAAPGRDVARPLVTFLKEEGVNIQLALDADSAFEEAMLHRPNVVLIDDRLPPSGGVELCQRLKSNTRTHFIPAVLFVSHDEAIFRRRALAAGVDAIFSPQTDIQERRARLWALLRTQALHRRQEKKQHSQGSAMRTRRRWVSGFVHDLQSSLGALQANFDYLTHALDTRPAARRDSEVEECVRDTRLLFSQLTRGLRTVMDYERFESGRIVLKEASCVLSDLADEVIRELAWQAEAAGKRLVVDVEREPRPLAGDRSLLKDAIQNMAAHALRQQANRTVTVGVTGEKDGTAVVSVFGDGDRLSEAERASFFEPYAAPGQKAPVGHGLGLALAKVVADIHGGSLTLDEGEGGGYRMVLRLKPAGASTDRPNGV